MLRRQMDGCQALTGRGRRAAAARVCAFTPEGWQLLALDRGGGYVAL